MEKEKTKVKKVYLEWKNFKKVNYKGG